MFIKQRQVRRSSRFQSRWSSGSRKRREHVASLYTTAIIQFVLFWFLALGAWRSLQMMQNKFPDLVWYLKFSVPFFIGLIAAVVFRTFIGNVIQGVEASRRPPSVPRG